jgi:endoglucanase
VSPSHQARRVGEVVGGKYRLVRYLAAGGMGTVYEAVHTVVKRRFAVKLLHPELASDRDSLARFQREAQAAGALESEHVAAAVDFGIAEDGSPFLVMEYLAGESVRSLLDRCRRVPPGRATDLVAQACRGIEAAHKAGIVHRDLNPQNIFVARREDGTDLVKILDFGIAKLEAIESAETRTGTILGTPAYLSPEQARGEKHVDHLTDVYGLGAVLYELLSGERPHPGDSHNAILHHICTQPARPLEAERFDVPAPLAAIVNRALSFEAPARQASATALAEELVPFAKREVWPSPPPTSGEETQPPSALAETLVRPSSEDQAPATAAPSSATVAATAASASPGAVLAAPASSGRHVRLLLAVLGLSVLVVVVFAVASRSVGTRRHGFLGHPLGPHTRFFVPPPNPGAVQQIAALLKSNATREAAAITAMEAMPKAVWFSTGTPEEVQHDVSKTVVQSMQNQSVPVLVAYNRPYRDCTGFSAGGAKDTATYARWIDGFVRGIGNEHALVVLEPDNTGIIPYNTSLDGTADWCKPTVTDANGATVPAPGATASEAYAQLNYAVLALRKHAPNALVYLDGTHSAWLTVGEAAYRLYKIGVFDTQGFLVNASNFQPTQDAVRYGRWISKCLYIATRLAPDKGQPDAFRRCASQPMPGGSRDAYAWAATDAWYTKHFDEVVANPAPTELAHFIVDTGRNGQPPLDPARYAQAPYHQPPTVIRELAHRVWCNPPGMGLGLRPTADTGIPLLDAYLWIKTVGESDGSCDIAGGARAWDYDKYNPWGLTGEGQKHFDPLWGMVNPAAGAWFPEQALELAQLANPPLLP